jgi:D-alanine-D-alanine ligase
MSKYTVAVLYGSQNPEHEVSIITALQVMHALKEAGHDVIPLYITKQGQWLLGDARFFDPKFYINLNQTAVYGKAISALPNAILSKSRFNQWKPTQKIDVAFPIFHGDYGEDGSIQGLLKLLNIPVVGSTIIQSAIGLDKYISKRIAQSIGIPTLPDVIVTAASWKNDQAETTKNSFKLATKLIIKPNRLGSSIGISIVNNPEEFKDAIDVALQYDSRVLVEPLLDHPDEINIAIMGNDPYQFSSTEQPLKEDALLSFQDKYLSSGGKKTGTKGMASSQRLIPAPITKDKENEIKLYSEKFFRSIDGKGMARLDFMIDHDKIYFNEINTIPGSLAFYLWEKADISFPKLVNTLVDLSLENYGQESSRIKSFESNLLASMPLSGKKT